VLTVKAVAQRLGISIALVYEWIACGALAHYRLGKAGTRGGIRVSESDLEGFLSSLRRGGEPRTKKSPAPQSPRRFKHLSVRSRG